MNDTGIPSAFGVLAAVAAAGLAGFGLGALVMDMHARDEIEARDRRLEVLRASHEALARRYDSDMRNLMLELFDSESRAYREGIERGRRGEARPTLIRGSGR